MYLFTAGLERIGVGLSFISAIWAPSFSASGWRRGDGARLPDAANGHHEFPEDSGSWLELAEATSTSEADTDDDASGPNFGDKRGPVRSSVGDGGSLRAHAENKGLRRYLTEGQGIIAHEVMSQHEPCAGVENRPSSSTLGC